MLRVQIESKLNALLAGAGKPERARFFNQFRKALHTFFGFPSRDEVTQATSAARRDLQKYAVELAVAMAEKGIRVDATEDKSLVEDFTEQLGSQARRNGNG